MAAHLTLALEDLAASVRHLRDAYNASSTPDGDLAIEQLRGRVRVQLAETKRLLGNVQGY